MARDASMCRSTERSIANRVTELYWSRKVSGKLQPGPEQPVRTPFALRNVFSFAFKRDPSLSFYLP